MQSCFPKSEAMVELGFCSAAVHDVSYDSLLTALELSALKPCLVRPARESVCTVTYYGHHVKRVLTRSDGKAHRCTRMLFQSSSTCNDHFSSSTQMFDVPLLLFFCEGASPPRSCPQHRSFAPTPFIPLSSQRKTQ